MLRNFHKMMSAEIGRQPALVALLLNLFELSSLGNYESSRVQPLWSARLAIRRSFHWDRFELNTWCAACHAGTRAACPKCNNTVPLEKSSSHSTHLCDMCAYLHLNHRFLLFSVKEFYVHSIRMNGLLDSMLESDSNWSTHHGLLMNALDDARSVLSDAFAVGDGAPPLTAQRIADAQARVDRQLALQHDCNKPTMRRLQKWMTLFEHLLERFDNLHDEKIASKNWTGRQQPQDFLMAPLLDPLYDDEAPPRDKWPEFYVADRPLAHLNGKRWCDVYRPDMIEKVARYCEVVHHDLMPALLSAVGVSPEAHSKLLYMEYASERRDMPDNRLAVLCAELCAEHPIDFHIVHYFLICMRESAAIKSYTLDGDQAAAQALALRLRSRIDPWESLPPDIDRIFVCRAHRIVYSDVSPPVDLDAERKESLERDGSFLMVESSATIHGVCNAYYNHELDGIVCSRTIKSASQANWDKLGAKRADWIESNPSRVKSISEAREKERHCINRLLESHSVLGHAWRIGRAVYTLCVKCGAVCEWRDACMTTFGMSCGRELRLTERERYTDLAQFMCQGAQAMRNHTHDDVVAINEHLLLPEPALDERGDLFERTPTPLFDADLEGELLANASNMCARSSVDNSAGGGDSQSKPKRRRGPRASEIFGVSSAADAAMQEEREKNAQKRMQPGVRKRRTNVRRIPYAKLHLEMPKDGNYNAAEWAQLTDEQKMYSWMPAGRTYWANIRKLRQAIDIPDAHSLIAQLNEREAHRIGELMEQGFYEKELQKAQAADECAESQRRAMRRVCVEKLTDREVVHLRELFIYCGVLERRIEIVCAYCRARCEKSSRFRRLVVNNINGTLCDGHLGDVLEDRGLVYIFLCIKCFDACKPLLKTKPVPLASDLFYFMISRRQKSAERTVKFMQRR